MSQLDTFIQRCIVPASANEVWARATSPEGINFELMPYMRMTVPASLRGKSIADIPIGVYVGRSWFLLFGILPFDYDDITIARAEPGKGFREESTMISMKSWVHERSLRDVPGGCEVTDQLTYQLRLPLGANRWLVAKILAFLFAHRHRRLGRWFAQRTAAAAPAAGPDLSPPPSVAR